MLPQEVFVGHQGRYRVFKSFFRNNAVNMVKVEFQGFLDDRAFALVRLSGDGFQFRIELFVHSDTDRIHPFFTPNMGLRTI